MSAIVVDTCLALDSELHTRDYVVPKVATDLKTDQRVLRVNGVVQEAWSVIRSCVVVFTANGFDDSDRSFVHTLTYSST